MRDWNFRSRLSGSSDPNGDFTLEVWVKPTWWRKVKIFWMKMFGYE